MRRALLAALGVLLAAGLASCGLGAPAPSHSASASATRTASATPSPSTGAMTPTLPDGAVLIGRVRLHNAQGEVRATVVAYPPTTAAQDADAVAKVTAECAGEYDADALAAIDASIMRVEYRTVAVSGSADAIIVGPRPSVVNSDDVGIASTGGLVSVSGADVPHCRREVTITGATSGTAYLVLPGGSSAVDWRTLPFGFFPRDDGVSQYDLDDCLFALSPEVDGHLQIVQTGGCTATVVAD